MAADPIIDFKRQRERRESYNAGAGKAATTDETAERLLPQNVMAEAATLNGLLIDPEPLPQVAALLQPDDFYRGEFRDIFAVMLDLHRDRKPTDYITVYDALERAGKLAARDALGDVRSAEGSSLNVLHYARIVKDKADLRRLVEVAGNVAGLGYVEGDPDKAFAEAAAILDYAKTQRQAGLVDDEFPILTAAEAMKVQPSLGLLGDILYENTVGVLYGPSQRWKSFVAISWGLSVALERSWFGRPVRGGGQVLYIGAEGGAGIPKRMRAWCRQHGLDPATDLPNFWPMLVPLHLLDDATVDRFIEKVRRTLPEAPKLIVIDTLARCIPGAEDGTKDGSKAYENADKLRRAFGSSVLLVAHPGKDATKGIRGWSGWFNNADIVMRVASEDDRPRLEIGDTVRIISEKPKDAEPFDEIPFTTVKQQWATDDGQFLSSLVVVPAEDKPAAPKVSDKAVTALAALAAHPNGAIAADWKRSSGLPERTFFNIRAKLVGVDFGAQLVVESNGRYHLTDAGLASIPNTANTAKPLPLQRMAELPTLPPPYRGGSVGSESWQYDEGSGERMFVIEDGRGGEQS